MSIKQKIRIIVNLSVISGFIALLVPLSASAVTTGAEGNNNCGVDTEIIKCDPGSTTGGGVTGNGVWALLLIAINILTGLVGIAAVGGIVYGAILYTSSGGNAEQTKKAIEFIRNVVIGIIAYGVMFSFLNFIIPGGLF